jgi:predicted RNA methylase
MNAYQSIYRDVYQEVQDGYGRPALGVKPDSMDDIWRIGDFCQDDQARMRRFFKRYISGEAIEYILGFKILNGVSFKFDRRANITDADAPSVSNKVVEEAKLIYDETGRTVNIVEIGVGAASLAILIKKKLGSIVRVVGLDIDSNALEVARENCLKHNVEIELLESDFFEAMPESLIPDIVYGYPPWGTGQRKYHFDVPQEYYLEMPRIALYPASGGITGFHEQVVAEVKKREWQADILFFNGRLPEEHVHRVGNLAAQYSVTWLETGGSVKKSIVHLKLRSA